MCLWFPIPIGENRIQNQIHYGDTGWCSFCTSAVFRLSLLMSISVAVLRTVTSVGQQLYNNSLLVQWLKERETSWLMVWSCRTSRTWSVLIVEQYNLSYTPNFLLVQCRFVSCTFSPQVINNIMWSVRQTCCTLNLDSSPIRVPFLVTRTRHLVT
jgi:hypothetical protein